MSSFESRARLAVRDLDDLVGLVPYLIGFHPTESLVVVVVEDGRVVVTARMDLAATNTSGPQELVERLFARFPAAEAWFFAYTEDAAVAWAALGRCGAFAGPNRLGRVIQVGARIWRADHAGGPSGAVSIGPAAAEAAVLGIPVRASRSELAAQVAGPSDAAVGELVGAFERAEAELGVLSAAERHRVLQRLCRTADDRDDYVLLAVLLAEPAAQLAALARLNRENAAAGVGLWSAVIGCCLVRYLIGPLGQLGAAAWLTGDGALQTVCLERLDRIDPMAPIGALLDWINTTVLPPVQWDTHREALVAALADQFTVVGQPPNRPDR